VEVVIGHLSVQYPTSILRETDGRMRSERF
jgi:hypothetical protein